MKLPPDLPLSPSLWRETASPAPAPVKLSRSEAADIAIIGAGFTGLSAALSAIEHGLSAIVLEASEVGWGASGRNGGVVSTKYRVSLSEIAARHGVETARQMYRIGLDAVQCVEDNLQNYGIRDADFARTGNLRCAHNARALAKLVHEAETARVNFGDTGLIALDEGTVRHESGSSDYVGGVLTTHGGIIHPLNYARGLAAAVRRGGGAIFERSPVLSTAREGDRTIVNTPEGQVTARYVILATDGYSDITRATAAVRKTVIPFRSAILATAPLGPDLLATVMRTGRSYSETRRMMRWFRPWGSRMLFGGRGAFGREDTKAAFDALETAMKKTFPQLEDVQITHRWSGLVSMTLNSLPQVGILDRHTGFALGYNGAGIAMSSLMGRRVVDLLLGGTPELGLMRRDRPAQVPLYSFRAPAVRLVAGVYQFLDRVGL